MKNTLLITFLFLFISYLSFSQGTVRGKITDKHGETLIGATVALKSNPSVGSVTDFDGNYSVKIADSTLQTLIISFISYKTMEEIVHPVKGGVLIKNFVLESSANEVKTVEVVAKANKAQNDYMEKVKLNSATTIDYISSETMKKTGDINIASSIKRVSGVSTNGQFITVRGIGDRYVKTAINGSRIPTLDPFTNNIKLDMFPANLVDNVIITKTASPDLPGDWAGAYISIETKDYPEDLAVNVETSFGYNNQSSFKDVIGSTPSSTDWLGYDNGLRNHDHNSFNSFTKSPTQYQQLSVLGLGDYYSSMGVTGWVDNSASGDSYFKLGLVQLGLLAPALFNDENAFATAKNLYYTGPYQSDAFKIINANVPETGKSFPDNWEPNVKKAPLNFSQSFSLGNQTKLFGNALGYIAGFRYGKVFLNDPEATANRVKSDGSLSSSQSGQASNEANTWSGLINLAYKIKSNNSISFLFMPNFTGENKAQVIVDTIDRTNNYVIRKKQFYEERRQMIYQFKSEHYIPSVKLKMVLTASYTNGKSSAPDFKDIKYQQDPFTHLYNIDPNVEDGIHRYYRYLKDNLFDSHLGFELPIDNKPELSRKIKFGGAYQRNDRDNEQYDYNVKFPGNASLANGNLNDFFSLDNFDISTSNVNGTPVSIINDYYEAVGDAANHTIGNSEIAAAYAMLDYAIVPRVRFSGGLRVEHAAIFTDVYKFDSLGYSVNDPRRAYSNTYPLVNPGTLDDWDYLPSANIIYKLKNDELAPVNLRFNYSKTLARPSIRELSDVALLDYEYREFIFGNSELKSVHINNYDVRMESYFKSGDNISVSLFYKNFNDHIELVRSVGLTWQNVDQSYVTGLELEGTKNLSQHFELGGNIAFIYSQTKFVRNRIEINGIRQTIPLDTISRPMYGQAPYVVNCMFTYKADSIGLAATLSYNVQGPRLVISSAVKEIPDVYEMPRQLFDLTLSKKFGKHFIATFKIRDILNAPVTRSYIDWKIDYDEYHYGTNYVLGITYKL